MQTECGSEKAILTLHFEGFSIFDDVFHYFCVSILVPTLSPSPSSPNLQTHTSLAFLNEFGFSYSLQDNYENHVPITC